MIVYICASILILLLIIFEKTVTNLAQLIGECLSAFGRGLWRRAKSKDTRNSDF